MKEPLKKRIESIEKQEGATEKFMYLCGIIGIVDIVFGILSLYLHFWIAAGILFLIAVRQAIPMPDASMVRIFVTGRLAKSFLKIFPSSLIKGTSI